MSSTPPTPLHGSVAPNQLELLWEKHRRTVNIILAAVVVSLLFKYGYQYYSQKQLDDLWGRFAVSTSLDDGYAGGDTTVQQGMFIAQTELPGSLAKQLASTDDTQLKAGLAAGTTEQKPWYLWLLAYSAFRHEDWATAESYLDQLQNGYPDHVLVRQTGYPVQFREEKKVEGKDEVNNRKPDLVAPEEGTAVAKLRANIAKAKSFSLPERFAKPEIPADAPKVEIQFNGDFGKAVIALLPNAAPKHVEKFLELVKADHWKGVHVDEVHRPGNTMYQKHQPYMLHFGYMTSKGANREEWKDKQPSKEQVDYESNDLSHYPGAVSARMEGDKSSVDRIWINVSDDVADDGERVVFGYVVDGLDNLKKICELSLGGEKEENAGSGTPEQDVMIESITKLEK